MQDNFAGGGLLAAFAVAAAVAGCGTDTGSPQEIQDIPVEQPAVEQAALPDSGSPVTAFSEPAEPVEQDRQDSIESLVELALAEVRTEAGPVGQPGTVVPASAPAVRLADSSEDVERRLSSSAGYGPHGTGSSLPPVRLASVAIPDQSQSVVSGAVGATPLSAIPADPQPERNGVMSDEQDFEAVSVRETIESDAIRRQNQQRRLVVFQPSELPEKPGDASVAQFALSVTHEPGTKVYPRLGALFGSLSHEERCAAYPDDEAAQLAFLDAGGPSADKLGVDPDGDGFACGWTPSIYRSML